MSGVKERLLNVSERLFCEQGFGSTTVREITSEAKCNVASVNYYFGSKEMLYEAMFRRRLKMMRDTRIEAIRGVMEGPENERNVENVIRAFARAFVGPLEEGGVSFIQLKLILREVLECHLTQAIAFDEMIIPVWKYLSSALMSLCPGMSSKHALFCIHSIVSQLIHLVRMKDTPMNLIEENPRPFDLDEAIEHIVAFSRAGVEEIAKGIAVG